MKGLKSILTAACAGVALLSGAVSHAANTVIFAGAGSSAMYNVFSSAAKTVAGAAGTELYSAKTGGSIHDTSSAGIPDQVGDLWVVWHGAANSRIIYLYLAVDSTVGVRAYCNNATLLLANGGAGIVADGSVTGFTNNLPADVVTSINGAKFNVGMTDITPADAKVATARSLASLAAGGLGYGPGPVGSAIKGLSSTAGGTSSVVPVDFNVAARPFQLISVGASPIIVAVSTRNTATGHLGSSDANNILRSVLAGFLDGTFRRTKDILLADGLPDVPVVTFIREPLSGTYNTTEYCIPQALELQTSQEVGVDPVANNPVNFTTPAYNSTTPTAALTSGGRVRVIGTGASTKWLSQTPDSLAYFFWSNGNASAASNSKYLTVDGIDPVLDSYTGGAYPAGASVTFKNIINGSYPLWSILRAAADSTDPNYNGAQGILSVIGQATATNNGGNFVAVNQLRVFRSHRASPDFPFPSNGNVAGSVETGGDVGGLVFPINADLDYNLDTGGELVGRQQ